MIPIDAIGKAELYDVVVELYEFREFERCWYADPSSDSACECANWPLHYGCVPECPLVVLREACGMEQTGSMGDVPLNPWRLGGERT